VALREQAVGEAGEEHPDARSENAEELVGGDGERGSSEGAEENEGGGSSEEYVEEEEDEVDKDDDED